MTRSRYGMLAGIAGAAFAAWWFRRGRSMPAGRTTAEQRGELIFSNSPVAG